MEQITHHSTSAEIYAACHLQALQPTSTPGGEREEKVREAQGEGAQGVGPSQRCASWTVVYRAGPPPVSPRLLHGWCPSTAAAGHSERAQTLCLSGVMA